MQSLQRSLRGSRAMVFTRCECPTATTFVAPRTTVVVVQHADGETKLVINQQEKPEHLDLFRSLGKYRFQAGRSGWVQAVNEGTAGKVAIADAVQFLPVEE